jgi:hypothetical protein
LAHLLAGGLVGFAVAIESGVVASDLGGAPDEGQLWRFPISGGHVTFQVATVPGFHLGVEDGLDGRNFLGVGGSLGGLLRHGSQGEVGGEDEGEGEGEGERRFSHGRDHTIVPSGDRVVVRFKQQLLRNGSSIRFEPGRFR